MMLKAYREGPTRRPNANDWVLDQVLVGVGVLRVLRGILRKDGVRRDGTFRAWDVSWWCNVTPPGTAKVLRRLERCGLVEQVWPAEGDRAATWRVVDTHELYEPLRELFAAERALARPVTRRTTRPPRTS